MDTKETFSVPSKREILLYNTAYYKYIFKKTEKIVCALFYILDNSGKFHEGLVVESVKIAAKRTLDEVITTLGHTTKEAQDTLRGLSATYVALQSNIRLAQASALLDLPVADMLCLEIDLLLKALRTYVLNDTYNPLDLSVEESGEGARGNIRTTTLSRAHAIPSSITRESLNGIRQNEGDKGQALGRRQTIKDILAAHGNATIKDISTKVTDCSEKTLQRELISMIKDGLVRKEGERRWSRYSLV